MKRTRLSYERDKINKTQEEVANDLGISTVYVHKIESGSASPGRDLMIKFGAYYGVNLEKLFPDIFFNSDDKKCINPKQEQEVS